MKAKLVVVALLLVGAFFVIDHFDHKHSTAFTAFLAIVVASLLFLWNPPPKHKECGPDDEAEVLRGGDGAHH
jgi:membrane-bound metal-dependent hydrolase YbcI (DUF457 family)